MSNFAAVWKSHLLTTAKLTLHGQIPDGDNETFQSCLCKLMNDVTCREKFGDKAITKSQEFTKETFAKNWLRYINDVITKYNDKN